MIKNNNFNIVEDSKVSPVVYKADIDKNYIFGVGVTNATKDNILEYVMSNCQNFTKKLLVVTPNPEILMFSRRHNSFQKILNAADLALCDGIGIYIAGKILGKPFTERLTGTDFVKILCKEVAKKPITVGFLGGRGNVAEKAGDCLKRQFPGLDVAIAIAGNPDQDTVELLKNNKQKIDILFVAFGFPKQEKWLAENISILPIKVGICVGGALDYISGNITRAPYFVRFFGFEWLY